MNNNQVLTSSSLVLPTLSQLQQALPVDDGLAQHIKIGRNEVKNIINGEDDRLLVVIGPCSIHDSDAALEYAEKLASVVKDYDKQLLLVMRCYFEKPRTTLGWKGLIFDPHLDGSDEMEAGIVMARNLLHEVNKIGLTAATEFLDLTSFTYLADLVSWGAIGARTTESQWHRQMASGLACPIGFKNGTTGDLGIALDAMQASGAGHMYPSIDAEGRMCAVKSQGNDTTHVILRGGKEPNYYPEDIAQGLAVLKQRGISTGLMIDCSHGNSRKLHYNQLKVCKSIEQQLALGQSGIVGVMAESFIQGGKQSLVKGQTLNYGQSITDACLSWHDSLALLDTLAEGVESRRNMVELKDLLNLPNLVAV